MRAWVLLLALVLVFPAAAAAEDGPPPEEDDPGGWASVYLDEVELDHDLLEKSKALGGGALALNYAVSGAFYGFGSMGVAFTGDKRLGAVMHTGYLASTVIANGLARYALATVGGDPKQGLVVPIVFGSLQVIGGMLWVEGAGNYAVFCCTGFGTATTTVNREAAQALMLLGGITGIMGFVGTVIDTNVVVKDAGRLRRRIQRGASDAGAFHGSRPRLQLQGIGVAPLEGGVALGFSLRW